MSARCEALVIALAMLGLTCSVVHAKDAKDASGAPFGALSEQAQSGPITIKSDSLELDYRQATLTYIGSVHVTQGDMVLTSDRLAIAFHQGVLDGERPAAAKSERDRVGDRIREIVADGNVRIEQEQRVATGQRAVFDHAKQTIVLSQDAVLEEGPNQVSGERIVVYLNEQRSVIESGSKERVKAVLYPDTVDDDGVPAADASAASKASSPPGTLADSGARPAPTGAEVPR